jgi:hypothetical protein
VGQGQTVAWRETRTSSPCVSAGSADEEIRCRHGGLFGVYSQVGINGNDLMELDALHSYLAEVSAFLTEEKRR